MFKLVTLFAVLLCASTASDVSKVIRSATIIGETDSRIVHVPTLWILKKWKNYRKTGIKSPQFKSMVDDKSLIITFTWQPDYSQNYLKFCAQNTADSSTSYNPIQWRIKIQFLHANGTTVHEGESTDFDKRVMRSTDRGSHLCWDKFAVIPELRKKISENQEDLSIFVEIWYVNKIIGSSKPTLEYLRSNAAEYQAYNNFGFKVLKDEETADILTINRNTNRYLHKNIIKTRAPELYNQLVANAKQEEQCKKLLRVQLNVSSPTVFDHLVTYIYTDETPILNFNEEWKDLFLMAVNYKIERLEKICVEKLANGIDVDNSLKWYKFAKCNNVATLEDFILDFLRMNAITMGKEHWDKTVASFTKVKC